jgi:protein-S-isoprenylcysteine O-methyltransferase Ste14
MFLNMAVLWVSWFALCAFDPHRMEPAGIIRYLGAFLVIVGISIFITALFTIKTLESYEGDLITKGVYSKIRHPMYFGFILWLAGSPMYFGAYFSFILSFLFIANILFWRYVEEKELENRYSAYGDYKKATIF